MLLSLLQNKPVRPLLMRLALETLVLLVVVGAVVAGHDLATAARAEAWQTVRRLEQLPADAQRLTTLQRAYEAHGAELAAIDDLVLTREELGQLVTRLEQLAHEAAVTVDIPEVVAELQRDEAGETAPWTGPVAEVSVRFRARGEPAQLLAWQYAVEHLPYLVRPVAWQLTVGQSVSPGPVAPAGGPTGQTSAATALLEGRLVVTIHDDDTTQ